MKSFFRTIHLYLGLAAGLVIMSCCFTGAVLVFEKELQEMLNPRRYFVNPGTLHLPIEQLVSNVKKTYPAAKIASVKLYPSPKRSVEVGLSFEEKEQRNKDGRPDRPRQVNKLVVAEPGETASNTHHGKKLGTPPVQAGVPERRKPESGPAAGARATHTAFVNPYTGEVLELYSYRETFFYTMFSLHRWLLGSDSSIGKTITGVSTVIFVVILLTGIILWWPRNKAILNKRLKIKTGASFKRLNHDLHVVLGFYSAIFLFIFAFTALAWSFKWFNNGIYTVTGTSMKTAEPPQSVVQAGSTRINYDSAFISIGQAAGDAQYYILRAPRDSSGIFTATVLPLRAHESAADNYYIDQYSGKVIGSLKYKDKGLGQRVRSTFKPVHVGSIFGWPSKVIAFIVCILGVTFPVTGVIMWLNRLKKNRRNKYAMEESYALAGENEF